MRSKILLTLKFISICLLAFLFFYQDTLLRDIIFPFIAEEITTNDIEKADFTELSLSESQSYVFSLLDEGHQNKAESFILTALKTYPKDQTLIMCAAVMNRSRWNKQSANYFFNELIRNFNSSYLAKVATLSLKLDQHVHPKENLNELIKMSEDYPDDFYLLWLTAIQSREQNKQDNYSSKTREEMARTGIKQYEKLLAKLTVGPVMVHHTYANLLTYLDHYEKALQHRFMAISMEAKSWSLQGLGHTLYYSEKYEWANAVWPQVVEKDSGTSVDTIISWQPSIERGMIVRSCMHYSFPNVAIPMPINSWNNLIPYFFGKTIMYYYYTFIVNKI